MPGCPFGENSHFLHYVPGGYNVVSQIMNHQSKHMSNPPIPNGTTTPTPPPSSVKSRMLYKYNTAEGCRFGDKCNFAHGPQMLDSPPHHLPSVSTFGASATAKISVDSSLAGPIIGKGGVNSKQICRQTGVRLSIRDHESDPNLKNIDLEGTFDQIKEASAMVRALIGSIGSMGPSTRAAGPKAHQAAGNNKTKMCENFAKGSYTFGERCHFAHEASELQKSGI